MAAGYASARPAVHPRVIERVRRALGRTGPFRHALDVGCGSGVSTAAIDGFASQRTGIEPVHAMTALAPRVAPGATFCTGSAERLPFADASFDCLTAAGSLNYADLRQVFPEARRVLEPDGVLVVYDFSPGRTFADGDAALDRWFAEFTRRWPYPPGDATELNPAILDRIANGFRTVASEEFRIPVTLRADFYLGYMLTETSVSAATARGESRESIREWCATTLAPVWQDRHEADVLFSGYYACLSPR